MSEAEESNYEGLAFHVLFGERELLIQKLNGIKEKIGAVEAGMVSRLEAKAKLVRQSTGKEFGSISLVEGDFGIKQTIPKKVAWDQEILSKKKELIESAGEKVTDYMAVNYKVKENNFKNFPEHVRASLAEARTVSPGKIGWEFSRGGEQ